MEVERLHADILSTLSSDPTTQAHLSDSSNPRWNTDANGFLCLDGCIYVPEADDLCLRVLWYKHDHPLSGHFSQSRTLELVRRDYTWPGVRKYVKSCTTCARAKTPHHRPYGLLKQLPIPKRPWDSISMDFIEQLPFSSGFTAILVVIDRLSKQAIFVPTYNTITSPQLAQLFLLHIFSKHGVPSHITSDRGTEFISHFFRSLGTALNMKLHFTSGYHPEGDGQTERSNQTLEQYLQVYCNYQQDNWADLLPLAEFSYNNAPSATTGVSPFFANKGYHPNLAVHPEHDLSSARAREYAVDLESLYEYLHTEMAAAQQHYQGPADAKCLAPPDFKVGDQVFVKAKYFRSTRPSKKLSEKISVLTPSSRKSAHYPLPSAFPTLCVQFIPSSTFHSSSKLATPNVIPNHIQPPPPPVEVDGEPEYKIAEILDSKLDRRHRQCPLLYLVHWAGYKGTDEETSWLVANELGHALELILDYHASYPDKPGSHRPSPTPS